MDPERLLMEAKKEHRDALRYGYLVPFQQIEFYTQSSADREKHYVLCLSWWESEAWVSLLLYLPIPLVFTYKAPRLLTGNPDSADSHFWWRVFETEWTVLLFGRWCADIRQRKLMWRLPPRGRTNLDVLGVSQLPKGAPYAGMGVAQWLRDHDAYKWGEHCRQ